MPQLYGELSKLRSKANLANSVAEVDKVIDILTKAREEIATSSDPHLASITLTKLQNPITTGFERATDALRPVDKGQKAFSRALDRNFPSRALPTDYDAMADQAPLINRAIAMHLLREGQFGVATTFIAETESRGSEATPASSNQDALPSSILQNKFASMYSILSSIRTYDLIPAIKWAQDHSAQLETLGSNLEFELNRLQFIFLFKGGNPPKEVAMLTDEERGFVARDRALNWGRTTFSRFQARHMKEIQQLSSAMLFYANLHTSPYRHIFSDASVAQAFTDAGTSFTRDFCALLGLSSESPLYVAATAGAIALPQLLKYTSRVKEKRTEWTTEAELAFETPLPASMVYHSIFVCPVSKEQTTEENPPVMLPCGHVVAQESLQCLLKGHKFKCPYCPLEGTKSDVRQIEIF